MHEIFNETPDRDIYVNEGQFLSGVAIGIILFGKTGYAMPPGSVENAGTFKYPVYYRAIPAACVDRVVSPEIDNEVLDQLIDAGREIEAQGCRAVIGACGYFANYLPMVRKVLKIPCFFSSIMQVPMIRCSMNPEKKIGIICADGRVLSSAPVLENCGVYDQSKIVISGAEVLPEMQKILKGEGYYNPAVLENGLVRLAKKMVEEHNDINAILLECTLFPTHAAAIQKALSMPVFDFSTLIDWVHSAVCRMPFCGYV